MDEPRGEVVLLSDGGDLSIVPMGEGEFRLVVSRDGVTVSLALSAKDVWAVRQATGGLIAGALREAA